MSQNSRSAREVREVREDQLSPFYFVQLADTQFGMFAHFSGMSVEDIEERRHRGINVKPAPKITGFETETALFQEAISEANRLRPAFVVLCGDMVNDLESREQINEVFRIAGTLEHGIPIHWVAGNHDVCEDTRVPTANGLASYRAAFGADYYSFQHGRVSFVVVNTCIMDHPENLQDEWDAQMAFLRAELKAARERDASHIIIFGHHPFFLEHAKEEDSYWTIPKEHRRPVVELFREYEVAAVFAGHLHRNNYASDCGLEMVASGPVGYPLGDDPSGYRVVKVFDERIEHDYYGLGYGPDSVDMGPTSGLSRG